MKINALFWEHFKTPMLAGIKVMTCRTRRMGDPGDTFAAFGCEFVLTHVMRMPFGYVLADCFEQEGCQSVQELTDIWKAIHSLKKVDPGQIVWAHCFRLIILPSRAGADHE